MACMRVFAACRIDRSTTLTILALLVLSTGCVERTVTEPSSTIARHVGRHDVMLFGSNRGLPYGADADTVIRFGRCGTVQLVEYGCGVGEYPGTYSTDSRGVISLDLGDYGEWPRMVMKRHRQSYYLQTESGYTGFIAGQRAGACPDNTPWWPFKMLLPDEG